MRWALVCQGDTATIGLALGLSFQQQTDTRLEARNLSPLLGDDI